MTAVCVLLLRAAARRAPGLTSANTRSCSSSTSSSSSSSTTSCSSSTSSKEKRKAKTSIQRPAPSPTHDWIGPPNPVSNLRPIVYRAVQGESELEQRLRALRQDTEDWNHDFWAKQNVTFSKEKESFIISHLNAKGLSLRDSQGRRRSLDSEEMAEFYKSFLDKNRIRHANYNREWYRRNFTITLLMARVFVQNFWKNLSRNNGKHSSSSSTQT